MTGYIFWTIDSSHSFSTKRIVYVYIYINIYMYIYMHIEIYTCSRCNSWLSSTSFIKLRDKSIPFLNEKLIVNIQFGIIFRCMTIQKWITLLANILPCNHLKTYIFPYLAPATSTPDALLVLQNTDHMWQNVRQSCRFSPWRHYIQESDQPYWSDKHVC